MECDATIFEEASFVVYFQVMHLFTQGLKIKPREDRGENIKRQEEAGRVSEHLSAKDLHPLRRKKMHKMLFYGHSGGRSVLCLSVYLAALWRKHFFPFL